MKIHIRVDDYPFGTPEDMEKYDRVEAEYKLQQLNELGNCMIGCVMHYMTDYEWDVIKTYKNLVPCFHGFTHGIDKWRPISERGGEFENLSESEILEKLYKYSHKFLNIKIVIPPFNSFTQEALNAFNIYGFTHICGGIETTLFGFDKLDFGNLKLKIPDIQLSHGHHIPEGEHLNHILGKSNNFKEGTTICFHLPWEKSLNKLISTVKQMNLEVIPYE